LKKVFVLIPPAQKELEDMPVDVQAALGALIKVLKEEGRLAPPQGKLVDRAERIFEMRVEENELQGRMLYYYIDKDGAVYGLVAFIKKKRKTPKQEFDLARQRLRLLKQGVWREEHHEESQN
jgi:phage-related protein